jgi:cyclopropane fatty-acyl-phospholipid synthase-like methyltransferase
MASLYFGNERHQQLYYGTVVAGIVEILGSVAGHRVLDYGSGEAGGAAALAAGGADLVLYDRSPEYHARALSVAQTHAGITVIDDAGLADATNAFDAIVLNSVAQYLTTAEFDALLVSFSRWLKPSGTLILGDIVPEGRSARSDLTWILTLALRNGYFVPLLGTMIKRVLKAASRPEAALALRRTSEAAVFGALAAAGFQNAKRRRNITLNPGRWTFVAQKHR